MMAHPIRVLLVEDDAGDRRLVERILGRCSEPVEFAVESAGTLSAAMERLDNTLYDIVLLDLGLPDSSGMETVRGICSNDLRLPVVVLTGLDDEQMGLLAIRNGATDYLVKDQSLDTLLVRTIRYAIERENEKNLTLDTNCQLHETNRELFATKKELEEKAETLQHIRDELESRVLQRTAELTKANEILNEEISAREKLEKALKISEANLRRVMLASPDGILVVDRNGIVQFVNPAAESIFGRRKEELLGQSFGLPLTKGEVTEVDIVGSGHGSGIAEMRIVETAWNGQSACVALLHDVTVLKQAEERLIKANEKLKELNRLKDEFVSTASHELRTPLSIIMGAVRLVLDEIPGRIVAEQRDVLTVAMENVKRLARLVDSLLIISKIESGGSALQISSVNVCELVRNTVLDCKPIARKEAVRLACEVPQAGIDVRLDPDKTKEILLNLISNSLKFTPKGGWAKVTCAVRDGRVLLTVRDSGIGIAKENIPKLFDKFTQFARKDGSGEQGTGLGLTIVKKLVARHGGTIKVESEPGKGTTFVVSLPLAAEAEAGDVSAKADELVEHAIVAR